MNDIKQKIKDKNKEINQLLETRTMSVSKLIEYMHKEFDREGIAKKCFEKGFDDPKSKYYQMDVKAILESWDAKATESKKYGSMLDNYIGTFLSDPDYLETWKLDNNYEYDYIFRTNTSTYINVQLLNEFIQSITDDNILYGSEIYSLSESTCPYPLCLFARGNSIILSKKHIGILLKDSYPLLYLNLCDDYTIGSIINSHWIKQNIDYTQYIKGIPHGWYKCTFTEVRNNHSLCTYYNTNTDINFLSQFITIQIRNYNDRNLETQHYLELHDLFSTYKLTEKDEAVNKVIEYTKNYDIFIGSILGYISFEKWENLDKHELYNIEIKHKAMDDAEFYKKQKPWI
jgi:hypothetical protein